MTIKTKIDLTSEQIRQIAVRRALGVSLRDLEKEFGFSRPIINRALSSDLGKAVHKEVLDNGVEGAKLEARRVCSDLVAAAGTALRTRVEEGDLKAVEMVFKVVGALDRNEEKQNNQQQAIQVILPSGVKHVKDVQEGS